MSDKPVSEDFLWSLINKETMRYELKQMARELLRWRIEVGRGKPIDEVIAQLADKDAEIERLNNLLKKFAKPSIKTRVRIV
jgi:hypothetical protein